MRQISGTKLLRHVLLPTDFSEIASQALEYVERLAAKGVDRVTVLHALDVPGGEEVYPPGYREIGRGGGPGFAGASGSSVSCKPRSPQSTTTYDPGHPLPAILRVMESQDYLVNRHGHPGERVYQGDFPGERGP